MACCAPSILPTTRMHAGRCECSTCHQPCESIGAGMWKCGLAASGGSACCESPAIVASLVDGVTTAAAAAASTVASPIALFSDPDPLFRRMLADEKTMQRLADECLAYAMTHGITLLKHTPPVAGSVTPTTGPSILQVPCTVLPYRLPTRLYSQVHSLHPLLNSLYSRVSRSRSFLNSTLTDAVRDDPFISRLVKLMNQVADETTSSATRRFKPQRITLAINRSDYMLQQDEADEPVVIDGAAAATTTIPGRFGSHSRLLQVEFNTISVGAGSLCNRVSDMHRYLLDRFLSDDDDIRFDLPANPLITNLTASMAHAHRLFLAQLPQRSSAPLPSGTQVVVLFVVQGREANMADQRHLEYALWREHGRVPVRRMTLEEVHREAHMDQETGLLWLGNNSSEDAASSSAAPAASSGLLFSPPARQLVSVVYFRAGYTPRDFSTESHWSALELLERSVAIKCPSIAYHLAGTKKMQQVLTDPSVLARFVPDEHSQSQIRACFAGIWQMDPSSIARAQANPSQYVLKPQREGGGNNLWGQEMLEEFSRKNHQPNQLAQYILMEKIGGPRTHSVAPILKAGQLVIVQESVSELGMIGCMITEEGETATEPTPGAEDNVIVHRSDVAGYLLRTKEAAVNEGGLLAGSGAINSLCLVP